MRFVRPAHFPVPTPKSRFLGGILLSTALVTSACIGSPDEAIEEVSTETTVVAAGVAREVEASGAADRSTTTSGEPVAPAASGVATDWFPEISQGAIDAAYAANKTAPATTAIPAAPSTTATASTTTASSPADTVSIATSTVAPTTAEPARGKPPKEKPPKPPKPPKGGPGTTLAPTTLAPTTLAPTTQAPTTQAPTTQAPTTQAPTTQGPTNPGPDRGRCADGDFQIDEARAAIRSTDGTWFLPAGTNLVAGAHGDGSFWQYNSATELTAAGVEQMVENWNFNTIRLNVNVEQNASIWSDPELLRVIDILTDAGVVAMVENHAYGTGLDPTPAQIRTTADGFASLARRYQNNPCVWFNPFNEPGGKVPWQGALGSVYHVNANGGSVTHDDAWIDWHVPVIDAIRAESDNVIVLDDTHWGQGRAGATYRPEQSAILTYGPELNERYDNLLYSVHFYDRWGGSGADMRSYLDRAKRDGLAIVVGEIGGHPTEGPWYTEGYWATTTAFYGLRPAGVGVLTWHGNIGWASGMAMHNNDDPLRTPVWDITSRSATEASGTYHWDWANNPPAAVP